MDSQTYRCTGMLSSSHPIYSKPPSGGKEEKIILLLDNSSLSHYQKSQSKTAKYHEGQVIRNIPCATVTCDKELFP